MKINLTQEEIKTIYEFLARTDLKGAEVPAYNNIMQKLGEASEDKTEELKKEIEELKKLKAGFEDKKLKGKDKAQK